MKSRNPRHWYDLIDWHCPNYEETKPGSTEYGACILRVFGLTDGRYVWTTACTRAKFADGSRAAWWIGNTPAGSGDSHVCQTFGEALALARAELATVPLPVWADAA